MHVARGFLAAAVGLDGRIYVLGGNDGHSVLREVEAYSPATNTRQPVASMLHPREGLAAATGPDGHIYAVGGDVISGSPGEFRTALSVEAYVPAANRWTPVASPTSAYAYPAAVRGPDGRVYAIGGDGVESYDTRQKRWTRVPDLPTGRTNLGAATGPDGRIYTVGGFVAPDFSVPTVEAYDVARQNWETLAPLPLARQDLGVAAGPDGRIYAIGGTQGGSVHGGPTYSVVDAYDPQSNRWQAVAPLRTPRQGLAAVRGVDGRIYALGGYSPTDILATVEAYGPLIHVTPQILTAGATVVLTGTNFAASATVSVTGGSAPGGQLLGSGQTDVAGTLLHPIKIIIPQGVRLGRYVVTVEDDRSRYPVTAPLAVVRRQAP
jgi:hypothetical protein